MAEESVTVTVTFLSGGVAWGPAEVAKTKSLGAFRADVAQYLGNSVLDLSFTQGDQSLDDLDASTLLVTRDTSSDGKILLGLVVKDFFNAKLDEIHKAMGSLPGLTDDEVQRLEAKYGWIFPPDLKAFLQAGVPPTWHNFHELAKDDIPKGSKKDTISGELENHATPPEAAHVELARQHPLIPIYGHRMMPSIPCENGLPVYSMHEDCSDNIIYGDNLWEYLERDDHIAKGIIPEEWKHESQCIAEVPFWTEFYVN